QVDWSFSVNDGSRRGNHTANTHTQHVETSRQCDIGQRDTIVVRDIGETSGKNWCLSTADQAMPAKTQQSSVTAPLGPVEGIIGAFVWLWVENEGTVGGTLLFWLVVDHFWEAQRLLLCGFRNEEDCA